MFNLFILFSQFVFLCWHVPLMMYVLQPSAYSFPNEVWMSFDYGSFCIGLSLKLFYLSSKSLNCFHLLLRLVGSLVVKISWFTGNKDLKCRSVDHFLICCECQFVYLPPRKTSCRTPTLQPGPHSSSCHRQSLHFEGTHQAFEHF